MSGVGYFSVILGAGSFGKHLCKLHRTSEDRMEVRSFDGGHEFPEKERQYAHKWLSKHLNT